MGDAFSEFDPPAARYSEKLDVLVVGEANPYGADPEYALFPLPERAAGGRLCRILGLHRHSYMGRLQRANLCPQTWSMPEARRRAAVMTADNSAPWRVIIMLGRKVADAFGQSDLRPFSSHRDERPVCDVPGAPPWTLVSLPHPSGLNRIWNRPDSVARARQVVRAAAPWLPVGEDAEARP